MRIRRTRLVSLVGPLALVFIATIGLRVGSGQQTVPFQGGIPLAPSGLACGDGDGRMLQHGGRHVHLRLGGHSARST